MKSLIYMQFREVRNVLLSLILASIFFTILGIFTGPALGIPLTFLLVGASIIYTLTKIHKMFFGEYASFYSALPISPKKVLGSQFLFFLLFFLILILLILFSIGATLFIFLESQPQDAWSSFTMELQRFLSSLQSLPPRFYLMLVLLSIIGIIHDIFSILFAMHVGSEKNWRRLGFGGPILVFTLLSIAESIVEGILANFSFANLPIGDVNSSFPEVWNLHFESLSLAVLAFSVVVPVFLVVRTYHSVKKKLSVY